MSVLAAFKTLGEALSYRHDIAMLSPFSYRPDVVRSDYGAAHGFPFFVMTSRWS